jgi:hypothetical protein
MSQVIFRRTNAAAVSAEEALALLGAVPQGRVLHHSGNNILADIADEHVAALQEKLAGWIVAPQTERIAVPDTRRHIS